MQFILMRVILIISFLFLSHISNAQNKSGVVGEWQFFRQEGQYHELTITDSFIYTYSYLRTPWRQSYILKNDTLFAEGLDIYSNLGLKEAWVLMCKNDLLYCVEKDQHTTYLTRKEKEATSVRQLYDLTGDNYTPELLLFEKEVRTRIKRLKEKLDR